MLLDIGFGLELPVILEKKQSQQAHLKDVQDFDRRECAIKCGKENECIKHSNVLGLSKKQSWWNIIRN